MRFAALALAIVPGAVAWALFGTLAFEGLAVLGVVGLLGGIWSLGQPLARDLRIAVAMFACLSFLGSTGMRMLALAGSRRPFSTSSGLKDLVDQQLPIASEGEYAFDKPDADLLRVIVSIDRVGQLLWKMKTVSLEDVDQILGWVRDRQVLLIRSDKDMPFQHAGWLASIAATHGHLEVLVAVQKFAWFPADASEFGAELSNEHWPDLELTLPIAHAEGPRVRVVATDWREGPWPPPPAWGDDGVPRKMERVATGVRYEMGGRATDELRKLAAWMRETPPAAIEADPAVPLKFVVAVQNEIRRAGLSPAAIVLPPAPSAEVRKEGYLPYPAAR